MCLLHTCEVCAYLLDTFSFSSVGLLFVSSVKSSALRVSSSRGCCIHAVGVWCVFPTPSEASAVSELRLQVKRGLLRAACHAFSNLWTLPPSMRTLRSALFGPFLKTAIAQDPEDRTAFFMLQRFPSPEAMSSYQNTDTFQAFTDVRLF